MNILPWPSIPSYAQWYATDCDQIAKIDTIMTSDDHNFIGNPDKSSLNNSQIIKPIRVIDSFMSNNEIVDILTTPLTFSQRFENLKHKYSDIFKCENIKFINERLNFKILDVGQDKFLIVYADRHPFIGTSGLGACIAVCATATDQAGKKLLALAHTTFAAFAVIKLYDKLTYKKCEQIKFYFLGGMFRRI